MGFVPSEGSRRVAVNFITEIMDADVQSGRVQEVVTRFPPEPNGYLHVGHTFACFNNAGLAKDYGGRFILRLDDTNPETEKQEFVDAIVRDLAWMGWVPDGLRFASDDFEVMHECAVQLIKRGLAYVESVSGEEMARLRGTVDAPGTPSPYRERGVQENLELFARMRRGDFKDGEHVLRAKIDLANPNMKLRDPALYRILHASHYRHGDAWCIYPLYDFAQALNDATNGVTHSLCSLEFVDNRAIYDWLLEHLSHPALHSRPHQYEFGRRNLEYTVVSKRKLKKLVEGGFVAGWDDPRMPTLSGLRRRGVTPEAIRAFAASLSVTRTNRTAEVQKLEAAIRDDLNVRAPRVMAVFAPLRVRLTNLKEAMPLRVAYWPPDVVRLSHDGLVALPNGTRVAPENAVRALRLTPEVLIEREDFSENPPKGFKRLTLGGTVRLRGAGIVRCDRVEHNATGEVVALDCTLLEGEEKTGGVVHWVSAEDAVPATFRLYDRLFAVPYPESDTAEGAEDDSSVPNDFLQHLNPDSLRVCAGFVEASVLQDPPETRYQFERHGYFWRDPEEDGLVFNRTIGLRDSWVEAATPTKPASKPQDKPAEDKHVAPSQTGVAQTAVALNAAQQATLEALVQAGVSPSEASVLAREELLHQYALAAAQHGPLPVIASWVVNDLGAALRAGKVRAEAKDLAVLVGLVEAAQITRASAKNVLLEMLATGRSPKEIVARDGLAQVSDAAQLEPLVREVIATNAAKVAEFKAGRVGLLGFFVGQVMKASGGQANASVVQALLQEALQ